jgi:hypothetical protein
MIIARNFTLVLTLLAGAGCAANAPLPTVAMTRAETSIEQADQASARRYDPGMLDSAKDKLMRAKAAAAKGDSKSANLLAEQSELDAELAAARGRSASAKAAAAEVSAALESLRTETARQAAP